MAQSTEERALTEQQQRLTDSSELPLSERVQAIPGPSVIECQNFSSYYGTFRALHDITFSIPEKQITALIGPSGCGKSTLLRCMNRMNDLVPSFHREGTMTYHGLDLYERGVDPVEVRRRIGMV